MAASSMRGLRTFCVAARRLSFKEAADELCVTPSAVSHQIKVLEETLGATLFDRLTREVALTERGVGVALVPVPLSNSWFASGALERAHAHELDTNDSYYFVYREEDAGSDDVCAFRDWVIMTLTSDELMSAVA